VALPWLPARSETVLPIPGTSQTAHPKDNQAAATLRLSDAETAELTTTA
jgi:aryl-alcohol dehydrogenase-like predicted oxidoreductase